MKTNRYTLFILCALLMGFIHLNTANATELSAPQLAIQQASDQLQDKLQDKSFTKDFIKITQYISGVIEPHTDFDKISALVLGKLWKSASPDEQMRFKQEFKTLLVRTYSRAFVEFKSWSVRFLPLDMQAGDNKVIVKTEVLQPGIQPISVDYRMQLINGDWKAYDIMIEGVSLVTNYRTTFTNEVQTKGSLSVVIDNLAKRNAEALTAKN